MLTAPDTVTKAAPVMTRAWAMPAPDTFTIKPIREFVERWLAGREVIVDPFARNSRFAVKWANDMNPNTTAPWHMEARRFGAMLVKNRVLADAVILDWPYSPTQAKRSYEEAGVRFTRDDAQDARMKKEMRELVRQFTVPGAVVLTFGWNTVGMGAGYTTREILIVDHGGAHNSTLCHAQTRD